jgi:hypothetical protein
MSTGGRAAACDTVTVLGLPFAPDAVTVILACRASLLEGFAEKLMETVPLFVPELPPVIVAQL